MKLLNEQSLSVIKQRNNNSYKGSYGRITLIGGSDLYGGAIMMATMAAVFSGAGLVTTLTDPSNRTALLAQVPEAMVTDYADPEQLNELVTSANVIVIGPGLGETDRSYKILKHVLTSVTQDQTLIIDSSAITLMADHPELKVPKATVIFTPHQMEWQRLSGIPIAEQTDERNQAGATKLDALVVVKSHRTHLYAAEQIFENTAGTPAQATGGMGDTLAGMIGGFNAQFKDPVAATGAAIYAHSAIADQLAQTQYVVLPHQISHALPNFMKLHEH